ncbi:MAG: acyloxyacyl hydrolase [Alphaproteobacteria bacterium]|nr:acyloxyacyl hydrolase [Alphaproteobacteria bacterium]
MKHSIGALVSIVFLALSPGLASAQDMPQEDMPSQDMQQDIMPAAGGEVPAESLLGISVGYYDIFSDNDAVDFRLEYRPEASLLLDDLKPWFGGEVTSDFTTWFGAGLLYDFKFSNNMYAAPSIGAGVYFQGDSDLDLGSVLEFRTQLEVGHEFSGGDRLGVSLGHMSNFGLSDDNDGTETLNLYWHMPFNRIFH